jgi:transglutaminase-like putative cysteine protease
MRAGFLIALLVGVLTVLPAAAQDSGYTWMLNRQTYVLDDKGLWIGTFELERKAHDAQAARNGGRIDITYAADQQTIEVIEAATLKADGRVLAVEADKIFDIAPQVSREVTLYTDHRIKSIVFPDVAAGDSIRYVYRITAHASTWPGFSRTTFFRPSARTKLAELVFDYPESLALSMERHDIRNWTTGKSDGRVQQTFSWANNGIIPAETGSTSEYDWAPRFSLSTFKSYAEIGDHYGRLHTAASEVTPAVRQLADEIVGAVADREIQARLLYEWVTQKVRYVGVSIASGRLTPTSAEHTIRNRYGDCKANVALLAALLAAKGIASEPVLINVSSPRYVLPEIPVADFDHVILYLPEFDRYLEPTLQFAAYGVLPWGHYEKPVLHAVEGKSRVARAPTSHAQENVGEVLITATITPSGRVSGVVLEKASGAVAIDLKRLSTGALEKTRARGQLRHFGTPGEGRWLARTRSNTAPEVSLASEFSLLDEIDLAAGEALTPPTGLRFLTRPGTFLVATHDTPRQRPFPCHAGRQIETIEVSVPAGYKPARLPVDRSWKASIAEYRSSYAFRDGMIHVRREFVAKPRADVCTPEQSRELVDLMSKIRRDLRSVVVFDRPL